MFRPRVIPCLLLKETGLVKTINFKNPVYVGDPINAIKIFNEKEVDELIFTDISATVSGRPPRTEIIESIASECFMPVCYGGGVRDVATMRDIFRLGIEKVSISASAVEDPGLIREAADTFGSQSIVVCIDVKKKLIGGYEVMTHNGKKKTGLDPVAFAERSAQLGAGELLVNSIDRDGTMHGYDTGLIKKITSAVNIPVIALGGAGKNEDFGEVIRNGGASAAAAGSLFVFHGPHRAVLITYPSSAELEKVLGS